MDVPKQGFGNTNDGNTARTFFANPNITKKNTGLNLELIMRFEVILRTLSCPYKINTVRYDEYVNNTARLYVQLYEWYPMPQAVHKVLIHGKDN